MVKYYIILYKGSDFPMKRRLTVFLLALALLMSGCERKEELITETLVPETTVTEATVPATVPADGDPKDVTCKGSYTGKATDAVVATAGGTELTDRQLQVWYWAEVAQYRQENREMGPDFARPLDTQVCEIDSGVNSWQQYFLKQALSSWHSAQALVQHSKDVPLVTEEAYKPNLDNYEKYMTGMPATEVLYGYHSHYRPNSMHQAYLEKIPQMLEDLAREKGYADVAAMAAESFGADAQALEAYADSYNRGYMYFTHMSHYIEPTAEELDAYCAEHAAGTETEICVDFRQILLLPEETEGGWAACEEQAQQLLNQWQTKTLGTEATFGELAHKHTQDPGTAVNGGKYQEIRKGQMIREMEDWCFDPARQPGDTTIVRSDLGVHVLYFSGSKTLERAAAEEDYYRQKQRDLIAEAKAACPMEVTYSAITLEDAQGLVSAGDLLYPDVAHERFPEVPLYLQQDYPGTMYGGFKITTNGCGITSFAMVASYLADDELTPPEMCAIYGRYSHKNGTDGMIFNNESAVQGFYLREKTYDNRVALEALEKGHLVVSIQHPGYWTRGGHYIVCESMNDEGLIQVRDSNIYNYFRVRTHKEDTHKWGNITAAGSGYWIFEHKITSIPACSRCGAPEAITESLLNQDYICEKCDPAILRRNTYLAS